MWETARTPPLAPFRNRLAGGQAALTVAKPQVASILPISSAVGSMLDKRRLLTVERQAHKILITAGARAPALPKAARTCPPTHRRRLLEPHPRLRRSSAGRPMSGPGRRHIHVSQSTLGHGGPYRSTSRSSQLTVRRPIRSCSASAARWPQRHAGAFASRQVWSLSGLSTP
jgi:hypothetical protein